MISAGPSDVGIEEILLATKLVDGVAEAVAVGAQPVQSLTGFTQASQRLLQFGQGLAHLDEEEAEDGCPGDRHCDQKPPH